MAKENILLGYGIVTINGIPVGLTRGGSSFEVAREYRNIEADGDKGPVRGRQVLDGETATLKVNALEVFGSADFDRYFSNIEAVTGGELLTSYGTRFDIYEDDYVQVRWQGKTLGGQAVSIDITNAINLGNISFTFADKDEVVPELEFTALYNEREIGEFEHFTTSWSITLGHGLQEGGDEGGDEGGGLETRMNPQTVKTKAIKKAEVTK